MRTIFLAALLTIGCNNNNKQQQPPPPAPVATPTVSVVQAPLPIPQVEKVEVEIESVGNNMAFSKTKIEVPAKSEVHLVFKNNSTMDVMQHNWVLVHEGKEADVAAKGLAVGASSDFVDPSDDDVIAHTPLAQHGKTVETTFTVPKYPGNYPYICTVMGHYIMMKGVLVVK